MKNKLIVTVIIAIISFFATSIFYTSFLYETPNHGNAIECYKRDKTGKCLRYQPTEEEIVREREEAKKVIIYNVIYKIFVLILFIIFTIFIIKFSKQYNKIVPTVLIVALFISYFCLFNVNILLDASYYGNSGLFRWILYFT